jgi:MoaA/NifB/PqqE/SkfB family radical SAM enzyme
MQFLDIKSLALEITSHCNIKCPQCSRTNWNGELADFVELKHWDVEKIMSNLELDKMTNLKFVRIEGDNGDALMHPGFEKVLDYVYNCASKPNIIVLTNGSMRSTNWWRKLGQKFIDRLVIQFSIDGLADTNHLYRVGSNYNKVIENAAAFISGGGIATQRCLIFQHNQHQLTEIFETAKKIGFKRLIVQPGDHFRFQGQPSWQVWKDGKKVHLIKPVASPDIDNYQQYNYNHLGNKKMFTTVGSNRMLCPVLRNGEITITYQGHLIPCCMHHADLYFDHPDNLQYKALVGDVDQINLNKRTLTEILSDQDYYGHRLENSLASKNWLPRCRDCCANRIENNIKINKKFVDR